MSFTIAKSEFEKVVAVYLSDSVRELSRAVGPMGLAREVHSYVRAFWQAFTGSHAKRPDTAASGFQY